MVYCKYCGQELNNKKGYEINGDEGWHLDCGTDNIADVINTTVASKKIILDFLYAYISARGNEHYGLLGPAIEKTLELNGYIRSIV